jgi:2-iminobutanoate/2-iminopropanoate deaminase
MSGIGITKSNPSGVARPVGNYVHAVAVTAGGATWIYVSGQLALDAEGKLVGRGDLGAQASQVFENLRAILAAHGAGFDDVVKTTAYVTTLEGLDDMRAVRGRYIGEDPPASTLVQVVALVMPDALIEVDLVAVV